MATSKTQYSRLYDRANEDETSHDLFNVVEQVKTWHRRFLVLLVLFVFYMLGDAYYHFGAKRNRLNSSRNDAMDGVTIPYSPATDQVHYVNKWLAHDPDSAKFMGKPRPEVDAAWSDLLEGTMIRVSDEELSNINASSVRYGLGGYVAGLGISHNLHCLKRIKQWMHPDYYYGSGDQDWEELEKHAEHCLEGIRQSVICSPDLSLYTFEWTPHSRVKPTVRVPQAHACVDWSRLHGWMIERGASWDHISPPPAELYDEEP